MTQKSLFPCEVENAVHVIEGYYMPKAGEDTLKAFRRAKTEAIEQMEIATNNLRSISIEDFMDTRSRPPILKN